MALSLLLPECLSRYLLLICTMCVSGRSTMCVELSRVRPCLILSTFLYAHMTLRKRNHYRRSCALIPITHQIFSVPIKISISIAFLVAHLCLTPCFSTWTCIYPQWFFWHWSKLANDCKLLYSSHIWFYTVEQFILSIGLPSMRGATISCLLLCTLNPIN